MNYGPWLLRQRSKVMWHPAGKYRGKGGKLREHLPGLFNLPYSYWTPFCFLFHSICVSTVGRRAGPGLIACQPVSQWGLSECQQQLSLTISLTIRFRVLTCLFSSMCSSYETSPFLQLLLLYPYHCQHTTPRSCSLPASVLLCPLYLCARCEPKVWQRYRT